MTDDFILLLELNLNKQSVYLSIITFLTLILVNSFSCTFNPFSSNSGISNSKISGKVRFNDGMNPKNVYVWLEGFELDTYTNEEGQFSITLPPADSQGMDGGFSGTYYLYFYHPNYIVDSLYVILANGRLSGDQDYLNRKGNLNDTVVLKKLIDLHISVVSINPLDLYNGKSDDDKLRVIMEFQTFDEIVTLRCRIWNKPFGSTTLLRRTGVFFQGNDAISDFSYEYNHMDSFYYLYELQADTTTIWKEFILPLNPSEFKTGEYTIIPFAYPVQELPESLIRCMGENIITFHQDYLDFPIQRNDCNYTVIGGNL